MIRRQQADPRPSILTRPSKKVPPTIGVRGALQSAPRASPQGPGRPRKRDRGRLGKLWRPRLRAYQPSRRLEPGGDEVFAQDMRGSKACSGSPIWPDRGARSRLLWAFMANLGVTPRTEAVRGDGSSCRGSPSHACASPHPRAPCCLTSRSKPHPRARAPAPTSPGGAFAPPLEPIVPRLRGRIRVGQGRDPTRHPDPNGPAEEGEPCRLAADGRGRAGQAALGARHRPTP